MQNLILHPAQQTKTTAQVVRRIGKRVIESGANFLEVYEVYVLIFFRYRKKKKFIHSDTSINFLFRNGIKQLLFFITDTN